MSADSVEITLGFHPSWLEAAAALYSEAGLGVKQPAALSAAFKASHTLATAWHGSALIGIGRVISDGVYYACVFDVAVAPAWQGHGVGRAIMAALEGSLPPDTRLYLTATFGHEGFYRRLGYRRHRTAMAKYPEAASPYLETAPEAR
jgi:GNAT superfamily N-acetyltransferase